MWSYRAPIDAVIQALKFRRLAPLAVPLGHRLADRLVAADLEIDLVSFVPLHWARHMGRGYDQAREIAKTVARRCDRPLAATLCRRRATPRQSSLAGNRRRANLRGAFRHRRRASIRGSRILLVDDVVTSGATLTSAARCLKRAGAHSVTAAVIARTPSPGELPRE